MRKCPTPGKKRYRTRTEATKALLQPHPNCIKAPVRAYWCRCGRWHLTSRLREGKW